MARSDDGYDALPADLQNLIARNQRKAAAAQAAEMLSRYGFTAEDIEQGIAEGGSVEVLAFRDDEDRGAS